MIRKLILFDLDWTLVHTGGAGVRALNHAFQAMFQIPDAMENVAPDGKTDPAIIREMIYVHLRREARPEEIQALCKAYVDRLKVEVETGPGYQIMPGIPKLIDALTRRSDVIIGLGTGNVKEGAHAKLSRAKLWGCFPFGGFADDSEDRPTLLAAGVQRGLKRAGCSLAPRDVIVIGDTMRDVQAGKAIGATTVAVATGPMTADVLAAYHPDFLYADLSETSSVLAALFKGS